ncbi:hypothetical protein [Streptomyces sp. NPDC026673]|uniref:hypothetical protein n=1 Tax=Streptomyces sp. NPDC026673 TaxID=3155724 RepID=UPI0033ED1F59
MAESPSGPPSDDDMLQALARHLSRDGGAVRLDSPGSADLSWHSILDCRIRRTTETRSETPRTEKGRKDLTALPTYTHIAGYRPGPPGDHGTTRRIELVREGSVHHRTCECGNGEWACGRCEGRGSLPCDPTTACPDCRGLEPCAECGGTGTPRPRPKGGDRAGKPASGAVPRRVRCAKCRRPEAACRTCAGRGRTECSQCKGTGLVDCPKCGAGGTVAHDACAGSGVVTTWMGGLIEQRSRGEVVRRPRRRPPFRVRLRTARSGHWRKAELTGDDALPGDLDATHAEALEPHLAPRAGEVHRTVVLRHLPLARITVPTDPDRVFYAFPGSAGIEVLPLPSRRRVARVVAIAAAVLVVAVLLLRLLV